MTGFVNGHINHLGLGDPDLFVGSGAADGVHGDANR
jgi:hypothetical protein